MKYNFALDVMYITPHFEFFNTHISHLAQLRMIAMALKWHHKNISNKNIVLKEYWRSSNMVFGLFDYDCTLSQNTCDPFH
jgi:hypothetical protein